MANIGKSMASHIGDLLRSDEGVGVQAAQLALEAGVALPPVAVEQILEHAGPADGLLQERFPSIYIACDKLTNTLKEKGRRFSGTARFTVECRMSQDRLDGLETKLRVVVEAVAEVLYASRGNWANGGFYSGAYEIQVAPARRGGKHVIQTAKVTFDVDVSTD